MNRAEALQKLLPPAGSVRVNGVLFETLADARVRPGVGGLYGWYVREELCTSPRGAFVYPLTVLVEDARTGAEMWP